MPSCHSRAAPPLTPKRVIVQETSSTALTRNNLPTSPESKTTKRQSCIEINLQKPRYMTTGVDMYNCSPDAPCNHKLKARNSCRRASVGNSGCVQAYKSSHLYPSRFGQKQGCYVHPGISTCV
jgi:hypothetical protein